MNAWNRRRSRRSLHRQILTIALVPALLVSGILVWVVYRDTLQQGQQALAQQGQLLAAQLAATLEFGLATGALDQVPAAIDATLQPATQILNIPLRSVLVHDPNQQVLYRTPAPPPRGEGPAAAPALERAPVDDLATFAAPIYLNPLPLATDSPSTRRYLGQVTVELAAAAVRAGWQRRFLLDLGLVALTFIGAVSLAHWTGQRLSGALHAAAAAIERIKNGDLDVYLPPLDSHELGTLQEGVNLLADTIARAKALLEAELAKVRGEYQQALAALQAQSQQAHQASQAKSLFLAKVSHEMRTPLYSMQGLLEQLLKTRREAAEEQTLRTLVAATATLYRHISDILDFTQLEKGKYAPARTRLELWTELEAAITLLEPLATQRQLYLDSLVEPGVPTTVLGDGKAFRTIVANLLANAIKYTETGGVILRVSLAARPAHPSPPGTLTVRLRVTDTGCGIPADQWEAIFAPFEQVDGALNRRYPGTGLGLSIVKGYCDLLGGHIAVASPPGQGATFTVWLPFQPVAEADRGRPLEPVPAWAGWRALVADPRPTFRASVEARLVSLGLPVEARAITPLALADAPSPAPPYDLLVVQNLAGLAPEALGTVIAGLHRWARTLIALEVGYAAEVAQRLQHAGVAVALWSGATRAQWQAALTAVRCGLPPDPAPAAASPPEWLRTYLTGKLVLVVEDYAINRAIMTHQLQSQGLRVIEAGDGEAAVALATQSRVDLVLMDIQMPGKDGIAAIQELRQVPACARLPILGFTASADKPTYQRILDAGADRVLTKPLSEAELIVALYQALQAPATPPVAAPAAGEQT